LLCALFRSAVRQLAEDGSGPRHQQLGRESRPYIYLEPCRSCRPLQLKPSFYFPFSDRSREQPRDAGSPPTTSLAGLVWPVLEQCEVGSSRQQRVERASKAWAPPWPWRVAVAVAGAALAAARGAPPLRESAGLERAASKAERREMRAAVCYAAAAALCCHAQGVAVRSRAAESLRAGTLLETGGAFWSRRVDRLAAEDNEPFTTRSSRCRCWARSTTQVRSG
jgi:hypothetical protein